MNKVLQYDEFINEYYDICKNKPWFVEIIEDCSDLVIPDSVRAGILGTIHEGLRENFDEAILFFWSVFLINPLIAIRTYEETDILFGKLDLYGTFKHINPIDTYSDAFTLREGVNRIYNPSIEVFLIYCLEALLQRKINPEELRAINEVYLNGLYLHDKEIMSKKSYYYKNNIEQPPKWINHRNLRHILDASDPHHIIILLDFFADKYGARLWKGNVGKYCYSKDKYKYIINYIARKYGSLSEYIEWDDHNIFFYYVNYYRRMIQYSEMEKDIDVIFATETDKERIAKLAN